MVRLGNHPEILPGGEDTYASYGLEWANFSNTPFRQFKSFVHEGGIASPFIIHGPVIKGFGHISHKVAHVIDLMPTCLEIAGVDYPTHFKGNRILPVEGKSLVPLLQGRDDKRQDALFWEHEGNRAVRWGKWKLVARKDDPWELYDLSMDRTETNNLAQAKPSLVSELLELYRNWEARSGVKKFEGRQTPIGWPEGHIY